MNYSIIQNILKEIIVRRGLFKDLELIDGIIRTCEQLDVYYYSVFCENRSYLGTLNPKSKNLSIQEVWKTTHPAYECLNNISCNIPDDITDIDEFYKKIYDLYIKTDDILLISYCTIKMHIKFIDDLNPKMRMY